MTPPIHVSLAQHHKNGPGARSLTQISCHSNVIYYSIHKLIFYVHFRLQKLKFKYLIDDIAIDI